MVRFFKHPFGLGRKDPIQEHITDPVKKNIIEPVKEHVTEPMKEQVRKLEREDPLHLKPLKRSAYQTIKSIRHRISVISHFLLFRSNK